ncbi:hypothetical protein [uncultured Shewanella sp.]|uniref:hypothetical protein n=1 Tax=uncultured Shewanella sp. TaxID=173975 RepID=UPI00261577DD|nr:hypothetical protein [uncultured Shewanella sp.]
MNSSSALLTFLLLVTSVTFGSLYFDAWQTNTQLKQQVVQLKQSQVILIVPLEQASVIANWMNTHPEYVEGLIQSRHSRLKTPSRFSQIQGVNDLIRPKSSEVRHNPLLQGEGVVSTVGSHSLIQAEEVIEESAEGVKTIALPHGGIRITTR